MNMLLKISWRNVWRNKSRSIVIILAIGVGLWGGTFATAIMTGMLDQQFTSAIRTQVSHIQIHNPEFVKERQTEFDIPRYRAIEAKLSQNPIVQSFTMRTLANGMLANASMTSGVEIIGINPETEKVTTNFHENVLEGNYFETDSRNPVLVGQKLADKMKIKTGNRLVLTFQDTEGEILSASFKVCGIYRTSNTMNDQRNVFVQKSDLLSLLGKEELVNEVAVLLNNIEEVSVFRTHLQQLFPEYEIRSWAQISPDLGFISEFSGFAMMILLVIIMMALAFGLLNTMLMTIFERTRELGVLMSVGMNKTRIFMMIVVETAFLVISGSLLGTFLGVSTVALTKRSGLDLTRFGGDAMSDYGFDAVIYPVIEHGFYFYLAILVLITSMLSAVYPAYKALKLNPADAVRKE